MSSFSVHNTTGRKVEEVDLPDGILDGRVNHAILHQTVVMYQANERQGSASTKERGSVSGGGGKPYRQKGTGRARAGSNRSPLWRGGGVVFGPHPRDYSYTIPKKMKIAALRESLKAKVIANDVTCVDRLVVKSAKTKDFAKIIKDLKLGGKILTILDESDTDITRVCRNIRSFSLMRVRDVNAYHILRNKKVLITKPALKNLLKRIK